MTTKTTRRKPRANRQMGTLKFAVAAGSLAASLLGVRLLAQQDAGAQTAVSTNSVEPTILNVPITVSSDGLPEAVLLNPTTGQEVSLDLSPIPQAVSPQIRDAPPPAALSVQPVASSKSSK